MSRHGMFRCILSGECPGSRNVLGNCPGEMYGVELSTGTFDEGRLSMGEMSRWGFLGGGRARIVPGNVQGRMFRRISVSHAETEVTICI